MLLLQNKVAVIYGSGSIGSAVARAFAGAGAAVFVGSHNADQLRTQTSNDARVSTALVDASDEKAVARHLDEVVTKAGHIDCCFNAISIAGSTQGTPLSELSAEELSAPVKLRVATNFLTARTAARHMVRRRSGVILMITATPARSAYPLTGSFGVEGAAVEGLCRTLASELGPHGVRVICMRSAGSPESFSDTATKRSLGRTAEEMRPIISSKTLLQRAPSLEEIGNLAAMLASDFSAPMTASVANATCGEVPD
jgi:3-oxoacyl-[acyl-carrier protein] reductase